jgi:hypothetical protein
MLYDKSQDFVLNQMFNNLYSVQKEIFIQSLIKGVTHQHYLKIDTESLALVLAKKRFNTWDQEFVTKKILDELVCHY